MPVVPIRKADSRGQGFSPPKPIELPAADEPWALMAASEMDKQGRLIDDRRDQGFKETDNRMVEDQQQPRGDYGDMDKDTFGKLNREAGTSELDAAERDNIVKAITKGMAARGSR